MSSVARQVFGVHEVVRYPIRTLGFNSVYPQMFSRHVSIVKTPFTSTSELSHDSAAQDPPYLRRTTNKKVIVGHDCSYCPRKSSLAGVIILSYLRKLPSLPITTRLPAWVEAGVVAMIAIALEGTVEIRPLTCSNESVYWKLCILLLPMSCTGLGHALTLTRLIKAAGAEFTRGRACGRSFRRHSYNCG